MSGTLAQRVPTNGMGCGPDRDAAPALRLATCRAFVAPVSDGAQDQASAQQDPDIARTAPVIRAIRGKTFREQEPEISPQRHRGTENTEESQRLKNNNIRISILISSEAILT